MCTCHSSKIIFNYAGTDGDSAGGDGTSSSAQVGAIAGGVVGGLLGLAIIFALTAIAVTVVCVISR